MDPEIKQVIESYHRCREDPVFFDAFYDFLFNKSPEIPVKFAKTDFKIQKRLLRDGLLTMLRFALGNEGVREEIEHLGKIHSHSQLDIEPKLYAFWLDSLCEAVALHDPQYAPELEALWRKAMQPGIDLMISLYDVT